MLYIFKSLSAILRFASERFSQDGNPVLKINPVDRLTLNRAWHKPSSRKAIIHDKKMSKLYQAVAIEGNRVFREMFVFLLLTGMRHNEARKLEWSMFDLDQALATIPSRIAQSRRGYTIPLSEPVVSLLRGRYHLRVTLTMCSSLNVAHSSICQITGLICRMFALVAVFIFN